MSAAILPSDQLISALHLAPFASQHHMSDYNKIKFGAHGSPCRYMPVSLHMPSQFNALQERKASAEITQRWWPSTRSSSTEPLSVLKSSLAVNVDPDVNLTEEILEAISSPLHTTPALPPRIKTSASHPINISAMIPPEILPILTSHLNRTSDLPVIFDVHPMFTLDRIFKSPSAELPPPLPVKLTQRSFSNPLNVSPYTAPGHDEPRMRRAQDVTQALEAALSNDISLSLPLISQAPPPVVGLPHVRPRILRAKSSSAIPSPNHIEELSVQVAVSIDPSLSRTPPMGQSATAPTSPTCVTSRQEAPYSFPLSPPSKRSVSSSDGRKTRPGNLFLSSCPGKKVRLDGPSRGRSGVCRDVAVDFMRMKSLGVRCVICCLDDDELDYLGVPWSEYSVASQRAGLDVLRIPTPEGLAPLTPVELDDHLTQVINMYTLRGIPVLVHCRGGVGRAGVFACAWLLKLGLCGWIETDPASAVGSSSLRRDTVQLVSRVIGVVRRRRSVKAVETYEQVKYLVDYVEFLRSRPSSAYV